MHGLSKARQRTSSFDASYLSDPGSKNAPAQGGTQPPKSDILPIEITNNLDKIFILVLCSFIEDTQLTSEFILKNQKSLQINLCQQ